MVELARSRLRAAMVDTDWLVITMSFCVTTGTQVTRDAVFQPALSDQLHNLHHQPPALSLVSNAYIQCLMFSTILYYMKTYM